MTGRIVAAGGHLHAGAINLELRDPACGDRVLFDNKPFFAPPDDLLYTAIPRLHEAGPIQTSWFTSGEGIPVAKGQLLDLHGLYEGQYARQLVMAITHIYIAPGGASAPVGCPPLPRDARQERDAVGPAHLRALPADPALAARRAPPARQARRAAGADQGAGRRRHHRAARLSLPAHGEGRRSRPGRRSTGASTTPPTTTSASRPGPRAVAGQTMGKGGRTSTRFDVPGRYQLFCYLHPMTMREQVDVVP